MSAKAEHYDIIRKPIITEKATMSSENGAIVFEVAIDSNKPMIKEAVEALFGVKVKAVNTTITKGKVKRFRGSLGNRKDVKKAYVTLEDGNTIDVSIHGEYSLDPDAFQQQTTLTPTGAFTKLKYFPDKVAEHLRYCLEGTGTIAIRWMQSFAIRTQLWND